MQEKIINVVGTMFFKDGKLLIDKPRKRPTFQMIGGSVEKGETTLQAAIRECHEELGENAIFDENLIEFVIPEGVNEGNFYRVVSILQELQAMGFVISLDSYMTKFALNSMKDRFSVKMIEENPGLKKLDDIQVDIKSTKPLNADDFVTELDRK